MKFSAMLLLLLAATASGAENPGAHREHALVQTWSKQLDKAGGGAKDNAVTRVTNLLKEMLGDLKKDLDEDEKLTKELLCWCNDQKWTKGEAIAETESQIKFLISEIERLTALVKELGETVKELQAKLKSLGQQLITIASVRTKEQKEYADTDFSYVTQMENLRAAILVLSKHHALLSMPKAKTEQGSLSLLQVGRKDFPWGAEHESSTDRDMDQYLMDSGDATAPTDEIAENAQRVTKFLQKEGLGEVPKSAPTSQQTSVLQMTAAEQGTVQKALNLARDYAAKKGLSFAEYTPGYSSQSGEVLGVMKQMYENLKETEHPNLIADEKVKVKTFIAMRKSLQDQLYATAQLLDRKEDELAQAKIDLANAKEEIVRQRQILAGLQAFWKALIAMCAEAQKNFDLRKTARLEEIKAVTETIGILQSDEARDSFQGTYGESFAQAKKEKESFLQVSSQSSARQRAAAALRRAGQRAGSPGLIALATSAQLDALADVKKAIDEMIATLKTQQEDEKKKVDWCKDELQENEMTTMKTEDLKKDLEAKIESLGLLIKQLAKEIEASKTEISTLESDLQRANIDRQEANLEFQKVVANQRATIEILEKALDKLANYYDFVQRTSSHTSALQTWKRKAGLANGASFVQVSERRQPASSSSSSSTSVSVTVGQESGFSKVDHSAIEGRADNYEMEPAAAGPVDLGAPVAVAEFKPSQGGGGVMSMIEKLIYDAKALMAEAIKSEAEEQAAYEAEVTDTFESIAALQKAIVTKTADTNEAKDNLAQAESDLVDTVKELEGLKTEETDLHKECDFYIKNFVTRQEARQAEIEGLQQAKHILNGASS